MNTSPRSVWLRRLTVLNLLLTVAGSAQASPVEIRRDRTDNTYTFTYDADEGEITLAASSRRIRRDDRVSFLVGVKSDPDAEVGERLRARISLELSSRKAARYDGTFTLIVKNSDGEVVHKQAEDASFFLRPRAGERRAELKLRFDLPSGDYESIARFRSNS
ncbi:MAG: hypothetical protein ABR505_09210 [Actinomycetota bacterium]